MRLAGEGFLTWCCREALLSSVSAGSIIAADQRARSDAIRSILVVTWLDPLVDPEAILLVGLPSTSFGRGEGA